MKRSVYITILFFIYLPVSEAQDSMALPKKLAISGYIKNLQSLNFDKTFKELVTGNLIHNRVNIKWKPAKKITAVAELRNRLFWGEEVKSIPGFAQFLKNENEKINLSKVWIHNKSLILHSNTERAYLDFTNDKLNIRVGRQRINWGMTTTWNPNDIFNAYNFLDFDFEERPGVDGGKFNYSFTKAGSVELGYAFSENNKSEVAALKYSLNKWNYDMQFIAGWYRNHITLGTGWAGSIKNAGFKGEVQYVAPNKDSINHFNVSLETDYMFKKGWYLNMGLLYNNNGLYKPLAGWNTINLKLSPDNLMPTKWNVILTTAKEISPLFSANMAVLYAPGTNLLILLPSFQYNIDTNLDINLIWQSFFAELKNSFEAVNHRGFLRMKWSF